jgi:cobalt-zinc-cadmium efflux system outer membrane protein
VPAHHRHNIPPITQPTHPLPLRLAQRSRKRSGITDLLRLPRRRQPIHRLRTPPAATHTQGIGCLRRVTVNNTDQVRTRWRLVLIVIGLGLFAGCATVDPAARLPDVQKSLSGRLSQEPTWSRNDDQRADASSAVQRLLQHKLSADAAVQIALVNNHDLQGSYEALGIAQADLVEAGLLENPVFSYTYYMGSPGSIVEASVVQDFVSVLSLSARKKAGQAAADRAVAEMAHRILELAWQVRTQYYTVVGDAQALELTRQVVTATDAAAELAQRQYAAGNLNRRDQAVQQAFYAQTLLDAAQAETQLASDREKLNRLMGLWGTQTRWSIPARLPPVPASLPAFDAIESQAISQRFDLAAAKKEAEATAQALSLTRQFRYLGPLGIGVAYKREPGGDKFAGPTVQLGLPIFNQGQSKVARMEAEYRRSQERVAALAVTIRSEAREARERLEALQQVVQHYKQVMLPLQQTILSETLKSYNGMLVGVYELLLSKQTQVQTARQYVTANRDFWLAWVDLEHAAGGSLAPPAIVASETLTDSDHNEDPNGSNSGNSGTNSGTNGGHNSGDKQP